MGDGVGDGVGEGVGTGVGALLSSMEKSLILSVLPVYTANPGAVVLKPKFAETALYAVDSTPSTFHDSSVTALPETENTISHT